MSLFLVGALESLPFSVRDPLLKLAPLHFVYSESSFFEALASIAFPLGILFSRF